jgi:hypothetical protein
MRSLLLWAVVLLAAAQGAEDKPEFTLDSLMDEQIARASDQPASKSKVGKMAERLEHIKALKLKFLKRLKETGSDELKASLLCMVHFTEMHNAKGQLEHMGAAADGAAGDRLKKIYSTSKAKHDFAKAVMDKAAAKQGAE